MDSKHLKLLKTKLGVISDASLAREFGVSRERIRQIRARYKISKPPRQTIVSEFILSNSLDTILQTLSKPRKETPFKPVTYTRLRKRFNLVERPNKLPCGNKATYNRGCRCKLCKKAHYSYCRKFYEKRRKTQLSPSDPRHGKYSTYVNWYCRCEKCAFAHSEIEKMKWQQRKQRKNK